MLFQRKQILCTNCGFLCWFIQHVSGEGSYKHWEIGKHIRNDFQAGTFSGVTENAETEEDLHFCCLRYQWVWTSGSKSRSDYANADDVRKPRRCIYYIGYQPSFSPEEHKELQREAQTRATVFKATLLGALIGAASAILAQILYLIFVS